jgi:hypothetical protein
MSHPALDPDVHAVPSVVETVYSLAQWFRASDQFIPR